MPGLTGILYREVNTDNIYTSVDNMITLLLHEDYYVTDRKVDKHFALGSIDLNKGDFISRVIENDSYILGFTGQVYDQEVLLEKISGDSKKAIDLPNLLLNLYKRYGPEGLAGLNGLYVAVIWDKKARRLHIVNDRYGFRKLYYWNAGNKFVFASEYKAISWFPDFPKKIDEFAFANLMTFGYVLDDRTLFEDIKLLPPASIAIVQNGNFSIRKYWDYSFYEEGDPRLSEDEYIDALAEKLTTAVQKRVNGVNRLALPLSGGLDSRTMAAVLYRLNSVDYIKAYSHGHRHCYDVRFGRQIAKKLGYQHEYIFIPPDIFKRYAEGFVYLSEGMVNCEYSRRMLYRDIFRRDNNFLVMSGFLGDSVCGGVFKYLEEDLYVNVPERIYSLHVEAFNEDELSRILKKTTWKRIKGYNLETIRKSLSNITHNNSFYQNRYANLYQRQRRFTSTLLDHYEFFGNSLAPFVDNDLVDFAIKVPLSLIKKSLLYEKMLIRHFPNVSRIGYSKTGMPIMPSRWQEGLHWRINKYKSIILKTSIGKKLNHNYEENFHYDESLRGESSNLLEVLNENEYLSELINLEQLKKIKSDFMTYREDNFSNMFVLITFCLWSRLFLSNKNSE